MSKQRASRRITIEAAGAAELDLAPRLRQAKLELLPVLHELLRTRSVTRTARAFGMTQPAVSQALQRLRAVFGDELLVALGRERRLTDRAETLSEPLFRALNEIDRLLRPARPFDPAVEAAHVVVTTADYVSLLLAPILAEICAKEAPNVVFEFVETPVRSAEDLARVDFFITPRAFGETLGKRIGRLALWQDDVVCIAPARNRLVPARLTPAQFKRFRHAGYQTNPRVPANVRARLMPTSALETARVFTVPNFLTLGAIVEQADCLALVPRKLAAQLVRWRALRIVELDYPRKQFAIDAYWSPAAGAKRGHGWVRDLLARAASRLD
jgi:DNA-binding transcriptional LysR family regulator